MVEWKEGSDSLPDPRSLARDDAVAVDLEEVRAWRGHGEGPDVLAEMLGEAHEGGIVLSGGLGLGAVGLVLHDDIALEIGLGGVEVHRLAEPRYGGIQEHLGVEGAGETLNCRVVGGGEGGVERYGKGESGRLITDDMLVGGVVRLMCTVLGAARVTKKSLER
jgi:hypothetical protein